MSATSGSAPVDPGIPACLRRVLVVGLGASGLGAARLLRSHGIDVVVVDDDPHHPAAERARAEGLEVVLDRSAVEVLARGVDLVVPSPGVSQTAPVLMEAMAGGIPIWSEPELALRFHPHRLLAVTGTNGKTSTTELVTAMVTAAGTPAAACGNIGRPVSEAAAETSPDTVLVAELSSFQLRFVESLRPDVAVLLNLAEDHLDWHGDYPAYTRAKSRIWRGQTARDWSVANADDPATVHLRDARSAGRRAEFSANAPVPVGVGRDGGRLVVGEADGTRRELLDVRRLSSQAPHHLANVAAAATVAVLAGVPLEHVAAAAMRYTPSAHRFETIATRASVTYVNDSKATNVHAASAALAAADDIVWIAGGLAKGADLGPLAEHLTAVRSAVLIGRAADELAEVCRSVGVPVHHAASIEEAVRLASELAGPGATVLLAPACASFDQFRDYVERGERFAAAVRALAAEPSAPSGGDDDA